MIVSSDALAERLKKKGLRPSYHRIRVLEYLDEHEGAHPTVDEIFDALLLEIPSLSKTTVYNALHALVETGLARAVNIDEAQTHFDGTLPNHGHFRCDFCGVITNFPVNLNHLAVAELEQFEIRQKDVYFRGLCPKCRNPK